MGERLLRPGIKTSERVAALIRDAGWIGGVFFTWLLTIVDDYGRFDARPAVLRAEVFPLLLELVREADVQRCVAACDKAGLIRLYTVVGKPYLEVLNFRQRMRATKSKWPSPSEDAGQCHDIVKTMPTETECVVLGKEKPPNSKHKHTARDNVMTLSGGSNPVESEAETPRHPDLARFLDATNLAIHANPIIRGKCVEMLAVAGLERSIAAVQTARKKHPGFGIPRLVGYALGIVTNQQVDLDTGNGSHPIANGKFKRRVPTSEDVG